MKKIMSFIIFLSPVLLSSGQSPCPGFFTYYIDGRTRETYGRIEIPHPPRNVAIHLRVSLSISTILPTQYVGKIELAKSRKESIKAIEMGQSLIYNVYFPLQRPIPMLTEILFNNHQYCIGHGAAGPVVTNIFLEHYLYPPGINPLAIDTHEKPHYAQNQDKFDDSTHSIETSHDGNISPSSLSTSNYSFPFPQNLHLEIEGSHANHDKSCGKPINGINQLIANGARTWPGQWPWLAAIFVARHKLEFQCAGSLITDKHVITAAHCRISNGNEIPPNLLLISLGRHRLDNWHEPEGVTREVEEFKIHPEYKNRGSAHADLGLLVMREKIKITLRIQPVCLWTGPIDLEPIVGKMGYVVGWGKDENGGQHLSSPRLARVPIVSQEACLRSNLAFVPSTTDKTFCAGKRDGSGPCNGDSGSGLMIHDQTNDLYYLRGIVSLSLLDKDTLSCDLSHYVVYADVAKFLEWINDQITV